MLYNLTMKKARVAVNTFDDDGLRSAESVQIDIAVEDIKEYPPVFHKVSYSFDLVENEILSESSLLSMKTMELAITYEV